MAKKIRLDFSKVEERTGWNTKVMPEGLHEFKIVAVDDAEAQDGTDMWVFALVPTSEKYKARRFPYYCKLQQNQFWKVRDLLVAAGIKVPKSVTTVDPNKAVGKLVAGEVQDATGQYEGRSELNGIYGIDILDGDGSADDSSDDEEEEYEGDEEEADDEPEEEEEDESLEALTLPELRKLAKEYGITTTGLKAPQLIEAIEEAQAEDEEGDDEDDLDDDDLEDEDLEDEEFEDDEEEPAPAPRRRAAPAKAAAPAKRVVKRR